VAELALTFILALSRNIVAAHCEVFQKQSWPNVVGMEIGGKALGLLGFGNIARQLSKMAMCLGMKVMAHDPFVSRDDIARTGVTPAEFDEIFEKADFVSVHVPLTLETRNLIGERELKSMKRTSFLINTARGHIVNEEALAKALKEKWIAGAALDVFANEPLNPESPLFECQNIIVTPHIGAHTKEAIYRMNMMAAQTIVDFFKGNISPNIVVNREVITRVTTRGINHES
jgi:D-3-phosphoglycerate dehydrogenase